MNVIYKFTPENFSQRKLKLLKSSLFLVIILLLLPLFNSSGSLLVYAVFLFILMLVFAWNYHFVSKCTRRVITQISSNNDVLQIEFVSENTKHSIQLHRSSVKTRLRWIGGRPRTLSLTIFERHEQKLEVFSIGEGDMAYQLEEINMLISL